MTVTKVALKVAYDGTEFLGFQRQRQQPTVQGVIEEAAARIFRGPVQFAGAGRTDTGVHATGQVVTLEGELLVPVERVAYALNMALPTAVRVREAVRVPTHFHPRFSATNKLYVYRIWVEEIASPFLSRYAWSPQQRTRLDWDAISDATKSLVGEHDFAAYSAKGREPSSTRRKIFSAEWIPEGDWTGAVGSFVSSECAHHRAQLRHDPLMAFHIEGNGFLYRMVRLIVGDLIRIGQGRADVDTVVRRLHEGWLGGHRLAAPAHGLMMVRVDFPPEVDPWLAQ